MTARTYSNVSVCEDCYFAHHYGAREIDGQWFAGDTDTPADREPLALLERYELSDNTDSETGDGIDTFSWQSCDGCGSHLGGSRYRLALFESDLPAPDAADAPTFDQIEAAGLDGSLRDR